MTTREAASRGEANILSKARALIAAAEKAETARADYRLRPKPELHNYREMARNNSPDIARALVEVCDIVRRLTSYKVIQRLGMCDELIEAREWLAKHGDTNDR